VHDPRRDIRCKVRIDSSVSYYILVSWNVHGCKVFILLLAIILIPSMFWKYLRSTVSMILDWILFLTYFNLFEIKDFIVVIVVVSFGLWGLTSYYSSRAV
jgi:hypothetical protein